MSKQRDSIRDVHPEAARVESPAPAGKVSVEEALAVLAQHSVQMSAAIAGIAGDREVFLKQSRDDIARNERIRSEAAKSCEQRTQEFSDRKWAKREGDTRFRCFMLRARNVTSPDGTRAQRLVVDPAHPTVELWAASEEEADGRYRIVCGITSTENVIRKQPSDQPTQTVESTNADESLPAGVTAI